jgi:histidinol-phosphate aminotransferase
MKWRIALEQIDDYHPGKSFPGSVKLSSNENPLGSSPLALAAAKNAADHASVYPPVLPADLSAALAARRGLASDQVIIGNGSDEVFTLAAAALIEPGCNAVGSQHTFSQYEFATRLFGGEFRAAPMNDLHYDLDAIAAAVDGDTKIVFLCTPNNPTGRIISQGDLKSFIARIPRDVLIIIDQAYGEYMDDRETGDAVRLIAEFDNLMVTGTYSKLYGLAAMRIGYGLASPDIISTLLKVKSPFNNNGPALAAAQAALDDFDFVERTLTFNAESKRRFSAALDKNGVSYLESQANFLCVETKGPAGDAVSALQQQGITVRDLSSFGLPGHVRITLGEPELMERIADILGEL